MYRFPYQTPNFNPYEDDEESQSPVTDAFEASLNNDVEDTQEGALEQEVLRADEKAANMQRLQGLVHAASQIGHGIAGADPRQIDPRAGSMFVDSELMRAKSARDTLERYHAAQGGRLDAATRAAQMAGDDASFRAGRQDAAAESSRFSAGHEMDQKRFAHQQSMDAQSLSLQRQQLAATQAQEAGMQLDPKVQAVLQDPGMQQDIATLDGYLADGQNPPGVGMFKSMMPQMMKGDDTIRFQQAAQGAVMRLLTIRKKGQEPSAPEIQNFMNESGLLSNDPDTVRLGYQRIKAQLDGYNQMMKGAGGGGGQDQGPDDWQDYQPGTGQGMFK